MEKQHLYDEQFKVMDDRLKEVAPGTEEPGVDFVMSNRFIKNMLVCMQTPY